jgi:hypothetical protein
VRVDHAGENVQARGIEHLSGVDTGAGLNNVCDDAIGDGNVNLTNALR